MNNALVTGAGGFIGSHLVQRLVQEGIQVRALVHYNSRNSPGNLAFLPEAIRSQIEVISGDIRDPFFIQSAVKDIDTVFHLAALIGIPYSYVAPRHYVDVNVTGTINLLHASVGEGVSRFVHTSTSETYGTAQYVPIDEDHPLQGQSPYSATKIGADKLAESYFTSFGLNVVVVRPFNTYGPRQSARAIIPTIITQALAGFETIHLGSLTPIRDLTFVTDTARGFIAAAKSENVVGKVINVGYGQGISIGELAKKAIAMCGSSARISCDETRVRPAKSEVLRLICNNSLAEQFLGWKPSISLNTGLERVIAFIKDHPDLYDPRAYNV